MIEKLVDEHHAKGDVERLHVVGAHVELRGAGEVKFRASFQQIHHRHGVAAAQSTVHGSQQAQFLKVST